MHLEDKALEDIDPKDLKDLLGRSENQRLDFKELMDRNDSAVWEFLRDVCSFANTEGGYIVIGAAERNKDGLCSGFTSVQEPDALRQRLQQIVLDGTSERVMLKTEKFLLDSGETIVVVQVPVSFQKPHMVTKDKKTEFWKRYERDKRTMTIAEIRDAVSEHRGIANLVRIENKLNSLLKPAEVSNIPNTSGEVDQVYKILDRDKLWEIMDYDFQQFINGKRYFRLTITPEPLATGRFRTSDQNLRNFLMNPPNQRSDGWSIIPIPPFQVTSFGIESSNKGYHFLRLTETGHLEFWNEIDEHFCWRQSPEEFAKHPQLYPYAVTEFPVSFLRFAKSLYGKFNINTDFVWRMIYVNIGDVILRPYHPESMGYLSPLQKAEPLNRGSFCVDSLLQNNFDPDVEALKLIERLYVAFGYSRDKIPFFDQTGNFQIK